MCLDLERDDESQPANIESDGGFDLIGLQVSLQVANTKRSVHQIINLANELIDECTDVSPPIWIYLYLDRFKQIMKEDSSLTKFQVKYKLYVDSNYENGLNSKTLGIE